MNFIGLRVGEDDLPATASYDGSIGSWPGTARKDRPTSSLKCALLALLICWHALIPLAGAAEEPYDYPFADPYVATWRGQALLSLY